MVSLTSLATSILDTDLIPSSESPWELVKNLEPQAPSPRDSDLVNVGHWKECF